MLSQIRNKIRNFLPDIEQSTLRNYTYVNSNIFTLPDANANAVTTTTINGNALSSGESYVFDSATKTVTLTASLTENDIVTIYYTYYDYSDAELNSYISHALAKISTSRYKTFRIHDIEIYPKPTEEQSNLIALIASILIKPNYSVYKLPTITVQCPERMSRDDKINKLIDDFAGSLGCNGHIELT